MPSKEPTHRNPSLFQRMRDWVRQEFNRIPEPTPLIVSPERYDEIRASLENAQRDAMMYGMGVVEFQALRNQQIDAQRLASVPIMTNRHVPPGSIYLVDDIDSSIPPTIPPRTAIEQQIQHQEYSRSISIDRVAVQGDWSRILEPGMSSLFHQLYRDTPDTRRIKVCRFVLTRMMEVESTVDEIINQIRVACKKRRINLTREHTFFVSAGLDTFTTMISIEQRVRAPMRVNSERKLREWLISRHSSPPLLVTAGNVPEFLHPGEET